MQTTLNYRTNRDLFSNYYLDEYLPETNAWDELSDDELREARADIMDLWEREKGTAPRRNEAQLEARFIRPLFQKLGIPYEVEESTSRTQRRPDYGFFGSDDAARGAFDRREQGGDFYENAIAVADAKRWGRSLDTRGSGEDRRDFENPSYQIHVYLQETPTQWAVLTNGKKWRLYYGPTSHRLDSYYEVDLPTILEKGDLEDFKYFYLFFRHGAFLEDAGGKCFLDEVYDESNVFAQELGEDLQDNIYEAIKVLSEGFIQYSDNNLSEDDLDLIHDSSLIYLYRLIFVLYAESEGRDLLDTNNEVYEASYSLNALKQEVVEELDSSSPTYLDWQTDLWDQLDELFKLIDQGSRSQDIPEKDLYIPAYNGGLFRTDPDENDSTEAHFLANHQVGDSYLAKVIELLTRSQNDDTGGKVFVDYSSLDVRELGSIYEGLLEYQLNVADEPLALEDGEYVSAGDDGDVIVQKGEVYLTTNSGERKATGSYYTPEYVVEYIVENTLEPLVEDIRMDLAGQSARGEDRGFAAEFANRVFELKILDPAMGSGHFLTSAIDYLAREIIDAQERQAAQQGIETVNKSHDINWARRQVAQRCIYGVDLNPLAVELSKVSLWLRTLAAEQPLAFLDHHLKTGNSLVGSDIETVLDNGESKTGEGQLTLQQSFDRTRQQALEHVTDRFEDLLTIDNESLDDVKEMEAVYEEVRDDSLYQRLIAMSNVHTAEKLGFNVPEEAYKEMAAALRNNSWKKIEDEDWFNSAQAMAEKERLFHWELEFPVAFYNDQGKRKGNDGFDAVIGNPPYVESKQLTKSKKDEINNFFDSPSGKFDLYIPFTELAIKLSAQRVGYVIPTMFTKRDYGKGLREYISESTNINTFVDFEDLQVFGDVINFTGIFILDSSFNEKIGYLNVPDCTNKLNNFASTETEDYSKHPQDSLSSEPWSFNSAEIENIVKKIRKQNRDLADITETISVGIQTGKDAVYLISESEYADLGFCDDIWKKLVRGRDIETWAEPNATTRVFYPYNEGNEVISEQEIKSQFPETYEYLKNSRDQLDGRDYFDESNKNWYELWCPRDVNLFVDSNKILAQEIAEENTFTMDSSQLFFNTKVFGIKTTSEIPDEYITANLNSNICEFEFKTRSVPKQGGFYEYKTQYLENIPIVVPDSQDIINDIVDLHNSLRKYSTEKNSLNLNLFDYLGLSVSDGIYERIKGDKLEDLYIPPSGLADSIFSKTSDQLDSLRLETVRVEHDGGKLVIKGQARYKPEDQEQYETDRWGYTQTDFEPIMEFVDLDKNIKYLIESYVPAVVDESGGFADFRKKATKTNSLVDRLEKLTLPGIDSVEDGLGRFIDMKDRFEFLDSEIDDIEKELDEKFYNLYNLSEEEKAIIEKQLANK